jgi:hypothetical protein
MHADELRHAGKVRKEGIYTEDAEGTEGKKRQDGHGVLCHYGVETACGYSVRKVMFWRPDW